MRVISCLCTRRAGLLGECVVALVVWGRLDEPTTNASEVQLD